MGKMKNSGRSPLFLIASLLIFLFVSSCNLKNEPVITPTESDTDVIEILKNYPFVGDLYPFQFSSYDRKGGNMDGFVYTYIGKEEGDYILAQGEGPGCITRFWFTTVIPPGGNLLFDLDGKNIEYPVDYLFSGVYPDFEFPLVGDSSASSGGWYSYHNFSFDSNFKIVTTHLFSYYQIQGFRGGKCYLKNSELLVLLQSAGIYPFSKSPENFNNFSIPSGESRNILNVGGEGELLYLLAKFSTSFPSKITVEIYYDGLTVPSVKLPLDLFFGMAPAPESGEKVYKSSVVSNRVSCKNPLFWGKKGEIYYFSYPLPFHRNLKILISNGSSTSFNISTFSYLLETTIPTTYGYLYANKISRASINSRSFNLLTLKKGRGKVVGVNLNYRSYIPSEGLELFLEGDDIVYLNGNSSSSIHGTGTEDFFNGGWYFKYGPFTLPTHGEYYHYYNPQTHLDRLGAYRIYLDDAYFFQNGIRFLLEHGPENDFPDEIRGVVYYYLLPGENQ